MHKLQTQLLLIEPLRETGNFMGMKNELAVYPQGELFKSGRGTWGSCVSATFHAQTVLLNYYHLLFVQSSTAVSPLS